MVKDSAKTCGDAADAEAKMQRKIPQTSSGRKRDRRAGNDAAVTEEIRQIKAACGDKILKVIIETCLLNEDEKIRMCHAVTAAGADYIKTSTGFSTAGATLADVKLMKENVGEGVLVKAAGGISGLEDAEAFIEAGASRLGTSRVVKAVKGIAGQGY